MTRRFPHPSHLAAAIADERQRERDFHAHIRRETNGLVDASSIEVFRGLMKASALITSLADKYLVRYGLTMPKMRLLFLLHYRNDGAGLLPSELSKSQGVMPNTVTSQLNSLRDAGLLEMAAHPHDKRKRLVRITEAGRQLLEKVGPEHARFIKSLLDDLTQGQRDQMADALNLLTDKLLRLHADPSEAFAPQPAPDDPACREEVHLLDLDDDALT